MSCASSAGWSSGVSQSCGPRPRRALEIVGVIFAFFWFWPLAVAYLVWKCMGYPMPADVRSFMERGFENPFQNMRWSAPNFGGGLGGSGNAAFDEYRRSEIERLEQERRRVDDEARGFRDFVDELKRAKDRSEFDAFMAKRRSGGQTNV